jgi:hypothetical protein
MKTILLTAAVLAGLLQSALGYSLGGPIGNGGDNWQVPTIGYGIGDDENAPKNLGEEYRRNTPVMFYTYDQQFADYFGSSGMAAVDKAFNILNSTFTNSPLGPIKGLDGYSAGLTEFALDTRRINYQAQALGIMDMKSITLGLMTEQLGLTDPVRFAWTLHDRYLPPGGSCPANEEYLVVQRNFDVISTPLNQLQYSPYVNDTLYSYQIVEFCTGPPPLALAVPFSVDPLADTYSPVASFKDSINYGVYFTGMTRDDVAGLRYLLQTNNVNYETISSDSLLYLISTNLLTPQEFPPNLSGATNFISTNGNFYVFQTVGNNGYGYGDLVALLAFAQTNNPAQLQAAYPGVAFTLNSSTFSIVSNATLVTYFTNPPVGSPVGTPPVLVIKTNYNLVHEFVYSYTFDNVFTNHFGPATAQLITATVGTPIGSPVGSPGITNYTVKKIQTTAGDFFALPLFYTNVCPLDIQPGSAITNVLAITNGMALALTNTTTTNIMSAVYTVNYFTNYSYVVYPVTCTNEAGASGNFQGVDKLQFVYVPITNYDTILNQFIQPVTNNYTLILQTNGQLQTLHLQRVVTTPDLLMDAADLAAGPAGIPAVAIAARNLPFYTANVLAGLAGPGTIGTLPTARQTIFTWNKSGPVFFNTPVSGMDGTPFFTETPGGDLNDLFYGLYFVLGSFDGTTNAPTVFPNGTSIVNLENQVLVHVSPLSVNNGSYGHVYPAVQFTANGGSVVAPFTWSASGLPNGLTMSPSGVLSGTPTQTGTFNFTVTLTDVTGLSVQWFYSFMIQ